MLAQFIFTSTVRTIILRGNANSPLQNNFPSAVNILVRSYWRFISTVRYSFDDDVRYSGYEVNLTMFIKAN